MLSGKFTVLILVLTAAFLDIAAQSNDIDFTHITSKSGLSSNSVTAILKDSYGLMWFGTEDGLNKYDGTNFTVYRHNSRSSESISSNLITALHEDKLGNLWVGTNGGSVSIYDRERNVFYNFLSSDRLKKINNYIRSISSDSEGNIWIAHFSGVSIVKPDLKNMLASRHIRNFRFGTNSGLASAVFCDSKNRMWVGTDSGVFLYIKGKTFRQFRKIPSDESSLAGDRVKSIAEDAYHNIWIGTGTGLSMLRPEGKNFVNYFRGRVGGLSNGNVFGLASDGRDRMWIGTENGLNVIDIKSGKISALFPDSRNRSSLNSKSIRNLFTDKEGILWVGTYQGGVNKYDRNLTLFRLKQSNPFDPNGMKAPVVTSFARHGDDNKVYVGTDGGGLHLFDKIKGTFSPVLLRDSKQESQTLSILSMEKDRNNSLWIGTFSNGLFRYNPEDGRYQHFTTHTSGLRLNNNDIFCIKEDHYGNIWIGTNGGGVNVYNPFTNKLKTYSKTQTQESSEKLPLNGFIRAIEEDETGLIWIGSYGSGIAVFDPHQENFSVLNQWNSELPNNTVLAIFSDSRRNIFVGTSGGGLSIFDKKANKFRNYSEENGLDNAVVYKIVEDQLGNIWCSTNTGISSFDLKTKKFRNYNYYNGVQNNNFIQGSGLVLNDGTIFFGGVEGFNYFVPSKLKTNRYVPPVIFTDLKISNRTVLPGKDSPIQRHISVAKEIELDYKQSFSLSYVALNYTSPQQNKYSYKLDGVDKEWKFVGTNKTAVYTYLSPGTYNFRVRASNNDGLWNNEGTSIIIRVNPPIWLSKTAFFLYFVLLAGSVAYFRYRGIKRLKRKFALEKEKMEIRQQIERERKEAEHLHELDYLKIKFLTNLSHEFRTPISLIIGPVENLVARHKDKESLDQLGMIKRNARRLLNLVNQLLDFRKMEEHELKLDPKPGEIGLFVEEVVTSFKDLSERKRIKLNLELNIGITYACFDHDKLERILFNLLSNAFKFTSEEGMITMAVNSFEDDTDPHAVLLTIKIIDTGIGIADDKREKIFERFFQSDAPASILNQGTGIGLAVTKEFVKMHGGTISLESELGRGSKFTVCLPLRKHMEMISLQEDPIIGTEDERSVPGKSILEGPDQHEAIFAEKPLILLVEDNEDFRFYLKDNLKNYYHVLEAANGKEGWQQALSQHPQLIVSDIMMPEMDGIELSRKIKADKRTSHIPVILLTALTKEEEQLKGLATGVSDYMTKPFNFEILNAKIRNLLDLNQTLKNAYSKQIKVDAPEVQGESDDEKLLKKILAYINENMNDPKLSVEDLSKHVGMSRSSLYHKLLEITGESPVEYIRTVKLNKAAALLEKSDLNVAQVAYMVGFATPNYFAKSFKAKFEMLPSEFRVVKKQSGANAKLIGNKDDA